MHQDSTDRFLWIDLLRAVAVLMVVLVHTGQYGAGELGLPSRLKEVIHLGARGVQLFFLISGFTVMLTFSRHQEHEKSPKTNFYIRRFFRIAPMFYIAIAYYLLQDGLGPRYWLGDAPNITLTNIVSTAFFMHGFNPYFINSIVPGEWSIAVEMLFYVLFPWLFYHFKKPGTLVGMLFISLAIKGILQFILQSKCMITDCNLWANYLFFYFPSQLPIFLLGLILYRFLNDNQFSKVHFAISLLPSATVMTFGFPMIDNGILNYGFLFFILAILATTIVKRNWLTISISWIGKFSYSIYLVHFAVLHWFDRYKLLDFLAPGGKILATINFSLRFLVVLTISTMLAALFYFAIEKPFITLGNNLIRKRENKQLTGLANA